MAEGPAMLKTAKNDRPKNTAERLDTIRAEIRKAALGNGRP